MNNLEHFQQFSDSMVPASFDRLAQHLGASNVYEDDNNSFSCGVFIANIWLNTMINRYVGMAHNIFTGERLVLVSSCETITGAILAIRDAVELHEAVPA